MAKKLTYSTINEKGERENRDSKSNNETNDLSEYSYLDVGYRIVVPIVVGVAAGRFIDTKLHTTPIFLIVLLIGGCILSFYQLYRLTNK